MRITKFRKFVSWNIISVMGYLSMVIALYFLVILSLASTQIGMREDLNGYFYDYITGNIILPYISFYKTQLSCMMFFMLVSILENRYYRNKELYGLRIFENNEKGYSIIFVTGLSLNFLPLYIFFMIFITNLVKLI